MLKKISKIHRNSMIQSVWIVSGLVEKFFIYAKINSVVKALDAIN